MSGRLPVTLCVSTRNAASILPGCIESCRDWVSEVVVVDMESDDGTIEVAERYGARVIQVPNAGWAEPGRQSGIDAAGEPWILVLDADERASEGLRELVERSVGRSDLNGVRLPRRNEQFGRFTTKSGIWPDWQLRLFRKSASSWPAVYTHTGVVVEGNVENAPAEERVAIQHVSFRTIRDWVTAMNRYTDHEADVLGAAGKRPSLVRLVREPAMGFALPYFRFQGFRSGRYGLTIALLAFCYRLVAELKLWERGDAARREA